MSKSFLMEDKSTGVTVMYCWSSVAGVYDLWDDDVLIGSVSSWEDAMRIAADYLKFVRQDLNI